MTAAAWQDEQLTPAGEAPMSDDYEDDLEDAEFHDPVGAQRSSDHHHLLNVFRDLTLRVDAELLDEISSAITERLVDPWRRAAEHDRTELSRAAMADWRVFERLADDELPGALLFLVANHTKNHLYVSNIVPTTGRSLGVERYNDILVDFANRFARPVSDERAIRCEMTSDWVDFAGDLGPKAFEALVAASIFPNGTHPNDRERWIMFILTARQEALEVDQTLLARWLEAEGFTPRRASDLVEEYDFGLKLLDLYDRS